MAVFGCDVAKDFVVLFNGKRFYIYHAGKKPEKLSRSLKKKVPKKAKIELIDNLADVIKENDIVVLEQTGTYGIRFAKLFFKNKAKVYIADGKAVNRWRRSGKKDDYVDAKIIREMYFHGKARRNIHPFHPQRYQLRTLVRHYQRLNKELTRSVNRLKQQLIHLFPDKDYYNYSRYKLFKELENIKRELLSHPESLSLVALTEANNISNLLDSIDRLQEEIESIVFNHRDYEILKSFGLGTMQMAALMAYYWDIDLFKDKDDFIAYCLMGVKYEQSGESVKSSRTDKSRSEIKGIFYMYFMKSYRQYHFLKPLAEYLRFKESEFKRRYVKFLDKLFEWIFYGLKRRKTFEELIEEAVEERRIQLSFLEAKIQEPESKKYPRYYQGLLDRYRNTSDLLLVCQDISTLLKKRRLQAEGVECQDYYEETTNKQNGEVRVGKETSNLEQEGNSETLKVPNGGIWGLCRSSNRGELPTGIYGALKRGGFGER